MIGMAALLVVLVLVWVFVTMGVVLSVWWWRIRRREGKGERSDKS